MTYYRVINRLKVSEALPLESFDFLGTQLCSFILHTGKVKPNFRRQRLELTLVAMKKNEKPEKNVALGKDFDILNSIIGYQSREHLQLI